LRASGNGFNKAIRALPTSISYLYLYLYRYFVKFHTSTVPVWSAVQPV
jgi:hypothetical protein